MVDSTPTGVGPPSTIRSMRPRRSASTCCAVVGETWPERLADGATTGRPNAARMSRATGCPAPARRWCRGRRWQARPPGNRRAFGSTSVSGPGQNAAASRSAAASKRASARAAASVGDMGDQRIERRAALGGVEPRDRLAVGGVGAEPVDGLGRKRDQPAGRSTRAAGSAAVSTAPSLVACALITRVAGGAVIADTCACGAGGPRL